MEGLAIKNIPVGNHSRAFRAPVPKASLGIFARESLAVPVIVDTIPHALSSRPAKSPLPRTTLCATAWLVLPSSLLLHSVASAMARPSLFATSGAMITRTSLGFVRTEDAVTMGIRGHLATAPLVSQVLVASLTHRMQQIWLGASATFHAKMAEFV